MVVSDLLHMQVTNLVNGLGSIQTICGNNPGTFAEADVHHLEISSHIQDMVIQLHSLLCRASCHSILRGQSPCREDLVQVRNYQACIFSSTKVFRVRYWQLVPALTPFCFP